MMNIMTVIPRPLRSGYLAKAGEQIVGFYDTEQEAINACAKWAKDSSQVGWIFTVVPAYRDTRKEPALPPQHEKNGLDSAIRAAKAMLELADACAVQPKRTCNRHDDCDAADAKARAKGRLGADHCHDDSCEDCFGA